MKIVKEILPKGERVTKTFVVVEARFSHVIPKHEMAETIEIELGDFEAHSEQVPTFSLFLSPNLIFRLHSLIHSYSFQFRAKPQQRILSPT